MKKSFLVSGLLILFINLLFSQELKLGIPSGHSTEVKMALFSPDSKLLATISTDHVIKIWDIESKKLIHTFVGHNDDIFYLEFSPDGKLLLSTSRDETAMVWDIKALKLLYSFNENTNYFNSSFASTGQSIITQTNNDTIRIYDIKSGKIKGEYSTYGLSYDCRSDLQEIAVVSNDSTLKFWDINASKYIRELKISFGKNPQVRYKNEESSILTYSDGENLKVWDSYTGRLIHDIDFDGANVDEAIFNAEGNKIFIHSNSIVRVWDCIENRLINKMSFWETCSFTEISPDDSLILTYTGYDSVFFWKLQNTNIEYKLGLRPPPDFGIESYTINPTWSIILSTTEKNSIVVYDIINKNETYLDSVHTDKINSLVFSPDGKYFVSTSSDESIKLWDSEKKELVYHFRNRTIPSIARYNSTGKIVYSGSIFDAGNGALVGKKTIGKFSPDEKFIAISIKDSIYVKSNPSLALIHKIDGFSKAINQIKFSENGKFLFGVSYDYYAKLWDLEKGVLIKKLDWKYEGKSSYFIQIGESIGGVVSQDGATFENSYISELNGQYMLTSYGDGFIKLWDLQNDSSFVLDTKISGIAASEFSNDGKELALVSTTNIVYLFDTKNGVLLNKFNSYDKIKKAHSQKIAFSHDNSKIFISSWDNSVNIWDKKSNFLKLTGHSAEILSLQNSLDGTSIITTSADKTVKQWDIESGKLIRSFLGHTSSVTFSNISPDGSQLLTSSDDGSFIIWNIASGKKLIQHFLIDNDPNKWVHISEEGFFDASPEAMNLMYWTKGLEIIEFSQLKDRFYVPGLWEKVMKGEPLPDTTGIKQLKLQPIVEVGEVEKDKLPIKLTKREGGYGKVSIFINGKEIAQDARGEIFDTTRNEQLINYSIKNHPYLVNGENNITVKATSADGFVTSRGASVLYYYDKKNTTPVQFFGVMVGVSDYANDGINLRYPVQDATSISKGIQLGAENLFGKEHTHIFTLTTNNETLPTKSNIKETFAEIGKQAHSEDIIFVYLSGHGVTWGGYEGDFYFLTSDATTAFSEAYNDPVIRQNNTISTNEFVEWLKYIPANKQVMVIDACGSGKAVENLLASRSIESSQIKAIDRMKDRMGMFIISGCAADAYSYEASKYGQGILTYSLLQGMKGAALKEDQYIDVSTLFNFAKEEVPKLAEGIGGIQQPQMLVPKGGSFDLGILDSENKKLIPLSNAKRVFVRSSFYDEAKKRDVLKIEQSLHQEMNYISSKGMDSPFVFFDTDEYPGSCLLYGSYKQEVGKIHLELRLDCENNEQIYNIEGQNSEEIVKEIISIIETM